MLCAIDSFVFRVPRCEALVGQADVPNDERPYLYNVDVHGLKVLLTLDARNALVDFGDEVFALLQAVLPSLFDPSPGLLEAERERGRTSAVSGNPGVEYSNGGHEQEAPAAHYEARVVGAEATSDAAMAVTAGAGGSLPRLRVGIGSAAGESTSSPAGLSAFDQKREKEWFNLFCLNFHSPQINLYDESARGSIVVTVKHVRVAEVVTLFAEKEQVSLDALDVRLKLAC